MKILTLKCHRLCRILDQGAWEKRRKEHVIRLEELLRGEEGHKTMVSIMCHLQIFFTIHFGKFLFFGM